MANPGGLFAFRCVHDGGWSVGFVHIEDVAFVFVFEKFKRIEGFACGFGGFGFTA